MCLRAASKNISIKKKSRNVLNEDRYSFARVKSLKVETQMEENLVVVGKDPKETKGFSKHTKRTKTKFELYERQRSTHAIPLVI